MAVKITNILTSEPKSSDLYFFDNNIWMYLFCPVANYNKDRQRIYSNYLNKINSARATIYVNSLILSEFVNSSLRIDFDQWKKEKEYFGASFKNDFVGSDRYKDTINTIKASIQTILRLSERITDNFNAINMDNVFLHLYEIDFNDSYYIELIKLYNAKLVTDDKDFSVYKIHESEIITFMK